VYFAEDFDYHTLSSEGWLLPDDDWGWGFLNFADIGSPFNAGVLYTRSTEDGGSAISPPIDLTSAYCPVLRMEVHQPFTLVLLPPSDRLKVYVAVDSGPDPEELAWTEIAEYKNKHIGFHDGEITLPDDFVGNVVRLKFVHLDEENGRGNFINSMRVFENSENCHCCDG